MSDLTIKFAGDVGVLKSTAVEVVDAEGNASGLKLGKSIVDITGTFNIGGTAMTASAAELNYLDIATLGTGAASKAVVLDASGDYTFPATATITMPSSGTMTFASGSTLTVAGTLTRTGRQIIVPVCGNAKVGATAGWVITGGTDKYSATLPAGQTNATLVIPISGLEVGDQVTAVACVGQVESAGNTVTMTMDVRKLTAAAADLTDASLATDNLGAGVTADTILSSANLGVSGLTETMAADESLYVLVTASTAASTDIDLMSIVVTVTKS